MSITLETIDAAFHSIQIKDAAGDALAIAADGSIAVTDNGGSLTVDGTVSISGSVTVTATDLDIRDLAFATDKVDVSGSSVELGATTLAALENITVSATNLDIRDLTHVSDSVKVGDGTDFLAIAADGSIAVTDNGGSLTVDGTVELGATTLAALENITIDAVTGTVTVQATNLDIRDLTHVSDSVKVGDGTDFLAVNNDGSINAVVSGSVSTNPGGYANWKVSNETASDISSQLAATPLTGRLSILIENVGADPVFLNHASPATTSDLRVSAGAVVQMELDDGAAIYKVCAAGKTADLRIVEFAP